MFVYHLSFICVQNRLHLKSLWSYLIQFNANSRAVPGFLQLSFFSSLKRSIVQIKQWHSNLTGRVFQHEAFEEVLLCSQLSRNKSLISPSTFKANIVCSTSQWKFFLSFMVLSVHPWFTQDCSWHLHMAEWRSGTVGHRAVPKELLC